MHPAVLAAARTLGLNARQYRARTHRAARVRHLAMWLLREQGWTLKQIGGVFDRDHTTVLDACRRIEVELTYSLVTRTQVAQARVALEDITAPLNEARRHLPLAPLLAHLDPDRAALAPLPLRQLLYTARRRRFVTTDTADQLAIRLLGLHPMLVWGDAWLYEAAS